MSKTILTSAHAAAVEFGKKAKIQRANTDDIPALARFADRVFRPDIEPGTGVAKDFPFLYGKENAHNLYFIKRNSQPVCMAGIVKNYGVVDGIRLSVASLSNVCTIPEYRDAGLASRIVEKIIEDLEIERISLMLVSGDGGLYRRVGCVRVGKMLVVEPSLEFLHNKCKVRDFMTLHVGPGVRKLKARQLLEIYNHEPSRFERSLDQMRIMLDVLGYQRSFINRHLFEILDHGRNTVAYAVTSQKTKVEGEIRVLEWAGSRRAFLGSLETILEFYDARKIEFHARDTDLEMISLLDHTSLGWIRTSLQGTVRPINVQVFFEELNPWFIKNFGGKVIPHAQGSTAEWNLEVPFGKTRKVKGFEELSHWLFDKEDGCCGIPLMLTDDLNYN